MFEGEHASFRTDDVVKKAVKFLRDIHEKIMRQNVLAGFLSKSSGSGEGERGDEIMENFGGEGRIAMSLSSVSRQRESKYAASSKNSYKDIGDKAVDKIRNSRFDESFVMAQIGKETNVPRTEGTSSAWNSNSGVVVPKSKQIVKIVSKPKDELGVDEVDLSPPGKVEDIMKKLNRDSIDQKSENMQNVPFFMRNQV